jgi:hypothetical protein
MERYQLEGALRTALIQAIAGFLLVVGAVTAFRQYALARTQAAADRSANPGLSVRIPASPLS